VAAQNALRITVNIRPPSFESFHPSVNFPWVIKLSPYWTVILHQISPVFTPSDYRNWITDRCCHLVYTVNISAMLNVSQCYHYSKENRNHLVTNGVIFILSPPPFRCYHHHFWGKTKLPLSSNFLCQLKMISTLPIHRISIEKPPKNFPCKDM